MRFLDLVRLDGDPVSIRVDAIQSVRRDASKGCVVVEFGGGRYELVRTLYADVTAQLRNSGAAVPPGGDVMMEPGPVRST